MIREELTSEFKVGNAQSKGRRNTKKGTIWWTQDNGNSLLSKQAQLN